MPRLALGRGVGEVGDRAARQLLVLGVERQAPGELAGALAGRRDRARPSSSSLEISAGVGRAERDDDGAGERRDVDDPLGAHVAHAVGERVGEDQPALGVGVVDLDGLAVELGDDVAGLDRRAARACSRSPGRRRRGRAAGRARRSRASASSTAAPPDMSIFISCILGRGLDRDAAGVEGDGLADEAERRAVAAAAVVAQHDQPRLLVRRPRRRRAGRPSPSRSISSRPSTSTLDRVVGGGDLAGPARRGSSGSATLEGRFWSSRARLAASAAIRAAISADRLGGRRRRSRQRLELRAVGLVGVVART